MGAIASPLTSTRLSTQWAEPKEQRSQFLSTRCFKRQGQKYSSVTFASSNKEDSLERSLPRSPRADSVVPKAATEAAEQFSLDAESEPALPEDDLKGNYDIEKTQIPVTFDDGSQFEFHTLWLRDACKVDDKVGMRPAQVSEHILSLNHAAAANVEITPTHLEVKWADGHPSAYPLPWLRYWANKVGKPLNATANKTSAVQEQVVWKSDHEIPKFPFDELIKKGKVYREFLHSITFPGVAIITGLPQDPDLKAKTFVEMMQKIIGRMNQHPTRDNRHWTISTEPETYNKIFTDDTVSAGFKKTSLDYAAKEPLLSHTDHSDYLTPAFIVSMHVLDGHSCNSVCDGFAVAKALKEEDPEAYELLTTRNLNFARYQSFYEDKLHKWGSSPMISLDENGNPKMIRVSEGKRTCFSVPHDEFPAYWRAYKKFCTMLDDSEYQKIFRMETGDCLVLNNWRTTHGRVYIPGGYRILLGGTFSRDPYVNRVRGVNLLTDNYSEADHPYFVELPHDYYEDNLLTEPKNFC